MFALPTECLLGVVCDRLLPGLRRNDAGGDVDPDGGQEAERDVFARMFGSPAWRSLPYAVNCGAD